MPALQRDYQPEPFGNTWEGVLYHETTTLEALLAFLRQHKGELLSALLREKMEAQGEEAFYEWEERAAILEFEAGLPRLEAERRAAHLMGPPAT